MSEEDSDFGASGGGPAPGDTIHDRYRLEALLGRDPTGLHFRAVDDLTEDPVTLTLVDPSLLPDKEAVRRFLRAGARMRGLRHSGHLSVYDVNVSPQGHYLAYEHVEGPTLAEWAEESRRKEGRVHPGFACAVAIAVLDALEAAHDSGTVHGGLDSSCVTFAGEPAPGAIRIKIRGFGLSAALGPGGGEEPEVIDDLRAVARILRDLVEGEPAFDPVLERASSEDPGRRFEDAASFRDALLGAGVPLPRRAPEGLEAGWTENCIDYSEETLDRFRWLVATDAWDLPEKAWSEQGALTALHPATGLEFVLVTEGEFDMGCDLKHKDEQPVHRVTVSAFLLAATPCTQETWDRVGGEDSREYEGPRLPINMTGQKHCKTWCAAVGLRLPSEAEWEYACRAGSAGRWCFGDDESLLPEYAWFKENSEGRLREAALLRPNAWGLFDMHGNVLEWCEDSRHTSYEGAPEDGSAWEPDSGNDVYRVMRGGSFYLSPDHCRSAYRDWKPDQRRFGSLGFRPAADLP